MPAIVGLKRHGALMQCWRKLPLWYLKTLSLKGVDLPDAIDYSCRARRPNLRRPPGSKRPPRSAERAVPRKGRPLFLREHPAQRMSPHRAHENSTSPRVVGSFQPLAEHHAAPVLPSRRVRRFLLAASLPSVTVTLAPLPVLGGFGGFGGSTLNLNHMRARALDGHPCAPSSARACKG